MVLHGLSQIRKPSQRCKSWRSHFWLRIQGWVKDVLRGHRHRLRNALLFALVVSPCAAQERSAPAVTPESNAAPQNPAILSFEDLVTLAATADPQGQVGARLDALLNAPFVHRETPSGDLQPHRPNIAGIGPVLRVGLWNIERGLNFELIRAALADRENFLRLAKAGGSARLRQKEMVEKQLATLQDADVVILNEADWGMKRTEYRDVTRELAAALHMDYAYGVEFVEVDPVFDLGTEQIHLPGAQEDQRLQEDLHVDRDRYHGLHGTAILSRYPIARARIFRLPVCYDWYGKEFKSISKLEQGKRWSAQKLFRERVERELRHGGRMALIAQVSVPDLPTGRATVVAAHLENKCAPACRRKQMQALLNDLKEDENPLVLAGDLNTIGSDNAPTSIRNEIMTRVTDYKFWIGQAVSYFHPLGIFKYGLFPLRYFHGYNDPTAFHLPILWDNRERPLFKTMEKFRFGDNHAFDFRGERDRTNPPRERTLADSNQREWKGFAPTYAFNRDFAGFVGRFKLDWIFVKPFVDDPRRAGQSNRFAPYFPLTMRALNESVDERVSDHAPMTVDLPLTEPAAHAAGQPAP
jgi:endonuclease/exonuclease/phosphatase family metal-dependent hydrolase